MSPGSNCPRPASQLHIVQRNTVGSGVHSYSCSSRRLSVQLQPSVPPLSQWLATTCAQWKCHQCNDGRVSELQWRRKTKQTGIKGLEFVLTYDAFERFHKIPKGSTYFDFYRGHIVVLLCPSLPTASLIFGKGFDGDFCLTQIICIARPWQSMPISKVLGKFWESPEYLLRKSGESP